MRLGIQIKAIIVNAFIKNLVDKEQEGVEISIILRDREKEEQHCSVTRLRREDKNRRN